LRRKAEAGITRVHPLQDRLVLARCCLHGCGRQMPRSQPCTSVLPFAASRAAPLPLGPLDPATRASPYDAPPRDPPNPSSLPFAAILLPFVRSSVTKQCALRGFILVSTNGSIFVSVEDLIVAEAGKTIRQARKEVLRCVNTLKLSADEAR